MVSHFEGTEATLRTFLISEPIFIGTSSDLQFLGDLEAMLGVCDPSDMEVDDKEAKGILSSVWGIM